MRYIIGITGASGSLYGLRLIEILKSFGHEIHLVVTQSGLVVLRHECQIERKDLLKKVDELYDINDIAATIASGSFLVDAMIIAPCTMKTVATIAHGMSDNLLTRAADVMLKEGRPLVLIPRETPFNTIHLENLLKLSKIGVKIIPASPAFYHHPQSIQDLVDMIIGKILDSLGLEHNLFQRWSGIN